MGQATGFGHSVLEAGLLASVVVARQLAAPLAQESACMFASATLGEVVDHRLQIGELHGTVRPQIAVERVQGRTSGRLRVHVVLHTLQPVGEHAAADVAPDACPGEKLFVDYSGDRIAIIDTATGRPQGTSPRCASRSAPLGNGLRI